MNIVKIVTRVTQVAALACIVLTGACSDTATPTKALTPGESARYGGVQPNVMQTVDHFSCNIGAGGDYSTWYCDYTNTTTYDDGVYDWTSPGAGSIVTAPVNCQVDTTACTGATSPAYNPYANGHLSSCDPYIDPQCEQPIPDSIRTKIRAAIAANIVDFATITKPDVRARCQEMLDKFNQMNDAIPSQVFVGASDTQGAQWHYGAYSPKTTNIHFDPASLTNLTSGSDKGWQVANTALHEAAHALGHEHSEAMVISYRGRTPVYESRELYFADLNPLGGCMKR